MPTYDHPARRSAQVARDTLVELRSRSPARSGRRRGYNRGMRYPLARLVLLPLLGGCSLIYNESNIPGPDPDAQEIDAEVIVDSDPSMLNLTGVNPSQITEGQGAEGSRKALIVVDGEHMVKANLLVMVTASAAAQKMPLLTVDMAGIDVDANGRRLAVPISLPVDDRAGTGLGASDMVPLDITVIQTVPGGPTITRTLSAQLSVRGLDELTAEPPNGFPGGLSEYSRVTITTGMLNALAAATQPVRIHATSSLTISPTIDISAVGMTGGPAGGAGGMGGGGGVVNGSPGTMGSGPARGLPPGGVGGFTGTEQVPSLEDPNRSSGGAGGTGGALFGDNGGNGGGGGGSIDLVAGGDLTVGTILAKGAAGTAGGTNPGGGGSGGVIVLRAGRNLVAGTLDVSGVPTAGRARFDAGGTAMVANMTSAFRGPMFVNPPLSTNDPRPMITVIGSPSKPFRYFFSNADGSDDQGPFLEMISAQGQKTFAPQAPLFPGLNQLCLLPDGAEAISNTRNCINIALLFKPPAL